VLLENVPVNKRI